MNRSRPRIALIGGTYRALCVLERLQERGERVVAFVGQEGEGERDFCSDILELCERSSIPARSARKLGEEIVRWLEDRIRPDLAIAVGVNSEIPLAIGGNSRLGLLEIIDCFSSDACPGIVMRQRGQEIFSRDLPIDREDDQAGDSYLYMVEEMLDGLEEYLNQLGPSSSGTQVTVPFWPVRSCGETLQRISHQPEPGPETDALENEVANYLEADAVVALRSHSDALQIMLSSLELSPGDEVICPGVTAPRMVEAIQKAGATPVFVDVEPGRLTVDPTKVESAISPRTRVVFAAHTFGQPAALNRLDAITQRAGLHLIEDAGGSLGARFGKDRIGCGPRLCSFRVSLGEHEDSTHAALLALPRAWAERIREQCPGDRLGNGAATSMRERLVSWDDRIAARRQNASIYSSSLVRYDAFGIPATPEDALSVYSAYLLRLSRFSRTIADDLHKLLEESGIQTRRIAIPLRDRDLARLPFSEDAAANGILLPVEQGTTESQIECVLDAIFDFAIG